MSSSRFTRASALLGAAAIAAGVFAGCGSSDEGTASTGAQAGATTGAAGCDSPNELRFNLAFTHGYSSALMALAQEKGWYRDECLDVELLQGTGSTDTVKLLASGAAKIGQADAISIAAGQAQGMPIRAVAVETQKNPFALIVREGALTEEQASARPFDFRTLYGKTYGSVEGGSPALTWQYLVEQNDLDAGEIDRVAITPPGLAEIVNGRVDFVTNYAPQVPALEQQGADVHVVTAEDLGLRAYGTSYAVNDAFADEHPEQVRGFLAATKRAMEYVPEHPEEAVDALCEVAAAQCTGDGKRELLLRQLEQYAALFKGADGSYQCMNEAAWRETAAIVAGEGGRAPAQPFTNEFLSGC